MKTIPQVGNSLINKILLEMKKFIVFYCQGGTRCICKAIIEAESEQMAEYRFHKIASGMVSVESVQEIK